MGHPSLPQKRPRRPDGFRFTIVVAVAAAALWTVGGSTVARAVTFRCEANGQVSYADRPCPESRSGRELPDAPAPSAADQAAARERSLQERRHLATLEQERLAQQRIDREERQRASRVAAQHDRQTRECTKLAMKTKRARDDYDGATPRDLAKRLSALRRADDDQKALCRNRTG